MPAKGTGWSYNNGHSASCRGCNRHPDAKPLETCPEGHKRSYERAKEVNSLEWKRTKLKAFEKISPGKTLCRNCGATDFRVLTLHHKNGGGNVERRARGGNVYLYWDIVTGRRSTEDLEILCFNCQWIDRYEKGEIG